MRKMHDKKVKCRKNIVVPNSDGLVALHCGNNWNNGVHCGPRTVNLNNYPWNVNTNIGSRLACDKVFKHLNNAI